MKSINTALKESINNVIHISDIAKGQLTEVHYDKNNKPKYAIIATNYFPDRGLRYFAIPILQVFLRVASNGMITFKVSQDELALAREVRFEDCNNIIENDFIPSIYEVNGYKSPVS